MVNAAQATHPTSARMQRTAAIRRRARSARDRAGPRSGGRPAGRGAPGPPAPRAHPRRRGPAAALPAGRAASRPCGGCGAGLWSWATSGDVFDEARFAVPGDSQGGDPDQGQERGGGGVGDGDDQAGAVVADGDRPVGARTGAGRPWRRSTARVRSTRVPVPATAPGTSSAWPPARAASAATASARWVARSLAPPSATSPISSSSPRTLIATKTVTDPGLGIGARGGAQAAGQGVHRVRYLSRGEVACAVMVRTPGRPGMARSAMLTVQVTVAVTTPSWPTRRGEARSCPGRPRWPRTRWWRARACGRGCGGRAGGVRGAGQGGVAGGGAGGLLDGTGGGLDPPGQHQGAEEQDQRRCR